MPQHAKPVHSAHEGDAASTHNIVVIGTSTGGVEALMQLARGLPAGFPAAIFVVLHLSPQAPSHLPEILNRAGPLPARHPTDGAPIRRGAIYVAPPDRHLLIERGRVRVVRGPRENRHRPAVDPLFRSAALAYGPQVIGVVLTGALDDGTAGLRAVKQRGGIAVVQDPADALIPSMPASAQQYVNVDYTVSLAELAPLLVRLVGTPAPDEADFPVWRELQYETSIAKMDEATMSSNEQPGSLVGFTCPECGGPLYELSDGQLVHYRCRVGHAFTSESVLAGQSEALEDALWSAYNTLRESAMVAERLAADARRLGRNHIARRMAERSAQQRKRAEVVLTVIGEGTGPVPAIGDDGNVSPEPAAEAGG